MESLYAEGMLCDMAHYRVVIQGRGLKIPSEDDFIIGFFATRLVESDSIENAKSIAIANMKNEFFEDDMLKMNMSDKAEITINTIEKVGLFDRIFKTFPRKGFTFYLEE